MTEAMIVEAVRAARAVETAMPASAPGMPDPIAAARFREAMASPAAEVPFAGQIAKTWNDAQALRQESLHRVKALTEMARHGQVSLAHMAELQYEVANLAFQQEVVTNIAKKASDAISTLVKNG